MWRFTLAHTLVFLSNYLPIREETGSCTPIPQPRISRSATLTQTCILSVIRILIFHCWDHRSELMGYMPLGKGGDWELLSSLGRFWQPLWGRTWNKRTSSVLKLVKCFSEEFFTGKCWFMIMKSVLRLVFISLDIFTCTRWHWRWNVGFRNKSLTHKQPRSVRPKYKE